MCAGQLALDKIAANSQHQHRLLDMGVKVGPGDPSTEVLSHSQHESHEVKLQAS